MTTLGVLLAGGKSARMGRDKGALVTTSPTAETLGARATATLRAVCDRVVCVGHGRGVPDDVERIVDPGDGPLVALACAIASDADVADVVVVLPVDMPDVDAALLARLLEARARDDAPAACLTLPHDLERAEPLPLVLSRGGARALVDAAARGERRFGDAVRALGPSLVVVPSLPENLNDPEAFDAWTRRGSGR